MKKKELRSFGTRTYSDEVREFVIARRKQGETFPQIFEAVQKRFPEDIEKGLTVVTVRGLAYRALGQTGHPQGRNPSKANKTKLNSGLPQIINSSGPMEQKISDQVLQDRVQAMKDRGYSPSYIAEFLKNKFGVMKTASEVNRMNPKGNNLKHPEVGLDWGKDLEFVQINVKVPVKQAAKALLALFGGYI
jgi:hypothetical protein